MNAQQVGFYGLEQSGPPTIDTPASLYGGWSLNNPARRFFMAGYIARAIVVPRNSYQPIAALDQIEDRVQVPPKSWLVGLAGASSDAEGFRWQIYDIGQKSYALTDQWDNLITGAQNTADPDSQPLVLPCAYLVSAPGLLQVKLSNLSSTPADMQLVLWFAVPFEGSGK